MLKMLLNRGRRSVGRSEGLRAAGTSATTATALSLLFLLSSSWHGGNHGCYSLSFKTVMKANDQFSSSSGLSPGTTTSRARFLSSSLASAFLGAATIGTSVLASDPMECEAATTASKSKRQQTDYSQNPRYIDKEIQMKVAENPDGNPRYRGVFVRRITGDNTPYTFPSPRPVKLVKEWPPGPPPFKPEDFFRTDNNDDQLFYVLPRFVYHIDEPAVASLTQYYRQNIPKGSAILDICSSWVSHYPLEFPETMKTICATGISEIELSVNDQLTGGYKQANLNVEPKLPYPDNTFDVVTCVVSIDYLIHPIEVLQEVRRVLKPGGKMIISQSNRCFPTKAIAMWLKMNDRQHLELINGYFHYAGGFVEPCKAYDITADVPGNGYRDPMFIVEAVKKR